MFYFLEISKPIYEYIPHALFKLSQIIYKSCFLLFK